MQSINKNSLYIEQVPEAIEAGKINKNFDDDGRPNPKRTGVYPHSFECLDCPYTRHQGILDDSLPVVTYPTDARVRSRNTECSICLGQFAEGDNDESQNHVPNSLKKRLASCHIATAPRLDQREPEELLKQEPKPWVLQVDGSTTKDASGAGLILTSMKGQRLSYALRFEFKTTNNEAEYEALVVGLELASAVGASHVLAKSDSQLVVGQVLTEYTVKEEVMQKYVNKVKAEVAKLQSFNIVRIPREENNEADYLAKLATAKEDAIPRNTPIRYLESPSIFPPDIQVQVIDYSDSWTGPIVDYVTNGTLPKDKVKARELKIRAAKYLMMGDVLYRRSFSLPYLRAEKIAFAIVKAARRLWPYFQAHPIKVLTDQPLRRIFHSSETSGRLIQWSIELGKFDIEYKPRIAIKAQVLADFLAEYTYPEPEELPKKESKYWVLQVDGSTTKDASGVGLILTSPKGQRLSYALRFEFKTTNNEAEYEALVVGLELASAVRASHVLAKSDSQLVVGQVLGEYSVKEEVMQKYVGKVKAQVAKLQSFNIVRIPKEENNEADYLAKLATAKEDAIPRNTPVRYLESPSIFSLDIQVQAINYSDPWTGPMVDYITNGTLPEDKVKARQLKIRAAKYLMMGDVLYRRSFSLPYLRCLTTTESMQAMEEVHQGICGDHQGGHISICKGT
ncbi:hypothetical protein RHSIM_Rhsim02G0177900 [Rhododendron simsii]|uniref:RNase H type-1 domain-containing protein n=1 Tax=Rhododendron simsii TaxID=118357 RepID=A0A834HD59_RHOSS|nr:hypothetical protein RHSIM_Rhsim02G0177900 [Rhododendron simsii]